MDDKEKEGIRHVMRGLHKYASQLEVVLSEQTPEVLWSVAKCGELVIEGLQVVIDMLKEKAKGE